MINLMKINTRFNSIILNLVYYIIEYCRKNDKFYNENALSVSKYTIYSFLKSVFLSAKDSKPK